MHFNLKKLIFIALIFIANVIKAQVPIFWNTGTINLCINGSYYLNPSTTDGTFSTASPTIASVNSSGYVTGVANGSTTVQLVTIGGTVTATVTVAENANPSLSITDPLAQSSYKFNNNPQGPMVGLINYVGYNGYSYSSQARSINTGFFRASNQLGDAAGCPYEYYIFRCTTCGTVPEYATRPQGSLSGSTISQGATGSLTYTSSNGGGPFTIVYLPSGGSNVTVNNISSTEAFNVASGTPTSTTSYSLKSVTDQITNSSSDFSGITATITVDQISVEIGTQIWSNKNLEVTTYRDGTPIPEVTDPTEWAGLTTGAWCYYNNDPANGAIYGKLYNWYAAIDSEHGGIAPSGWHVPTNPEWTTQSDFLGGSAIAGGKMKTTGIGLWNSPNTDATNESGFAGLPGGIRDKDGIFNLVGLIGYWWSTYAVEPAYTFAWSRTLYFNYGYQTSGQDFKTSGFSVRLIKD